jgi:uncharacterized protein YqeY
MTDHADGTGWMRQRLRAALTTAMKARDQVRVRALRDGLGAIDNAEAVELPDDIGDGRGPSASLLSSGGIAGARAGLGTTDAERRALTAEQVEDVIRRQVDERLTAADEFERSGAPERAAQLRDEADVLRAFLTV